MRNELKHLNRRELLEIMVKQGTELERVKKELEQTADQLREKEIKIETAGSVAEAALSLNRVFESAQAAADQYLAQVIKMWKNAQTDINAKREAALAEARSEAEKILKNAEKTRQEMLQEVDAYKEEVQRQIQDYFNTHPEISQAITDKEKEIYRESE